MIRLSSSFELDACAKVKPVSTVSMVSGREVDTPLTVELTTWPVWICLIMKVKRKFNSSSLVRRSRNAGTGVEAGGSGSCKVQNDQHLRLAARKSRQRSSICT